jgi:Uma2 family endonuclease
MSTATLNPEQSAPAVRLTPRNDVNLLRGVSWEEYLAFRDDPRNDRTRMYYGDGVLLLMTTGQLHERIKMLLDRILFDWATRNEINMVSFGHWTLQRPSLLKGLEADNCYYVSSLAAVVEREKLDLEVDPPPDLAIEVDITTHSSHKFAIYAGLGVRELWIWQDGQIVVNQLSDEGTYQPGSSLELADFPLQAAADAINHFSGKGDLPVIQAFRSNDPTFSG